MQQNSCFCFLFVLCQTNTQMSSIYSALYDPSHERKHPFDLMLWFIKHHFAKGYDHTHLNQY